MKRNFLFLMIAGVILAGLSCKEYSFENPNDPQVTLKAPANVVVYGMTDTSANFRWANPYSKQYPSSTMPIDIESTTDGAVLTGGTSTFSPCIIKSYDDTSAIIEGTFTPDGRTIFRIRFKALTSQYSELVIGVTNLFTSNIKLTSFTETTANLEWMGPHTFETGFVIELSIGDWLNFSRVDSVGANITAKSVVGVYLAGTRYYFSVRAKSAHNYYGGSSNSAVGFIPVRDVSMVSVSGGTFQMGSTSGYSDEGPVHSVTVGPFYIDKTELTYEKWTEVRNWGLTNGYTDLPAGRNGSNAGGANIPVTMVNWYDILKWCNARSEKEEWTPVYYTDNTLVTVYRTGQLDLAADAVKWNANGYRLPTEAEWEFAARGGTKSQGYIYSGSNNIDTVAWYVNNSGTVAHVVATKGANELGLYDMSANVWEWCWDWYGAYDASAQTDPKGPSSGTSRVGRGGAFNYIPDFSRVTNRNTGNVWHPNDRLGEWGIRCVQH